MERKREAPERSPRVTQGHTAKRACKAVAVAAPGMVGSKRASWHRSCEELQIKDLHVSSKGCRGE